MRKRKSRQRKVGRKKSKSRKISKMKRRKRKIAKSKRRISKRRQFLCTGRRCREKKDRENPCRYAIEKKEVGLLKKLCDGEEDPISLTKIKNGFGICGKTHCYDKISLKKWLETGRIKDPMSNMNFTKEEVERILNDGVLNSGIIPGILKFGKKIGYGSFDFARAFARESGKLGYEAARLAFWENMFR